MQPLVRLTKKRSDVHIHVGLGVLCLFAFYHVLQRWERRRHDEDSVQESDGTIELRTIETIFMAIKQVVFHQITQYLVCDEGSGS